MLCDELEHLESRFIAIRAEQGAPGVTDERRMALEQDEVQMIMAIKDHQCFGHGGERCPGDYRFPELKIGFVLPVSSNKPAVHHARGSFDLAKNPLMNQRRKYDRAL